MTVLIMLSVVTVVTVVTMVIVVTVCTVLSVVTVVTAATAGRSKKRGPKKKRLLPSPQSLKHATTSNKLLPAWSKQVNSQNSL